MIANPPPPTVGKMLEPIVGKMAYGYLLPKIGSVLLTYSLG